MQHERLSGVCTAALCKVKVDESVNLWKTTLDSGEQVQSHHKVVEVIKALHCRWE